MMCWLRAGILKLFAKEAPMNINHNGSFTIRVDFPALDNLVNFLREDQQKQVDAVTARVRTLTARLKASGDSLSKAVSDEKTT